MSIESSVTPDVYGNDPSFKQHSRDKQKTVADGRVFLTAHQRDAVFEDPLLDSLDPAEKSRDAGERRVQHMPLVVVAVLFRRAAPEFLAQEQVLPFGGDDLALQRLTVELRVVLRIGLRPDIDQDVDLVLPQQSDKVLIRVIGMPDREEPTFGNNKLGHETPFLPYVNASRCHSIERHERVGVYRGGPSIPLPGHGRADDSLVSKVAIRRLP